MRDARRLCRDLSGGEVYRFALAMAMAKASSSPTPPVLLLDGFFDKSDQRYGVGGGTQGCIRAPAVVRYLSL